MRMSSWTDEGHDQLKIAGYQVGQQGVLAILRFDHVTLLKFCKSGKIEMFGKFLIFD